MQNLEVAYLIYRAQLFYPVVVIVCCAAAAIRHAATLQQQHNKVMALMNQCRLMPVIQGKWVRATASHRLVPGDVMVLQEGRALCDMVMLRGACLVQSPCCLERYTLPQAAIKTVCYIPVVSCLLGH